MTFDYNFALTAVTAAIALNIAYQQYRLGKDKLRNDLFERRMEVFRKTQGFISKMNFCHDTLDDKDLNEMREAFQMSHFLFEKDIVGYLDTIWTKGHAYAVNKDSDPEKSRKAAKFIADQYNVVFEKFSKSMRFETLSK